MEQLRVPDRTNVHLLRHPLGTVTSDAFLFKAVGELQPAAVEDESLFLRLFRVKRGDEARLAEKEIQVINRVEVFAKCVIGVDGEISGDNREP